MKELLIPDHPQYDLDLRFRRGWIEIDVLDKSGVIATTTIENWDRVQDARSCLRRLLPRTVDMGVVVPLGVTYTSLKPTTGSINFIRN